MGVRGREQGVQLVLTAPGLAERKSSTCVGVQTFGLHSGSVGELP